MAGRVKCRNGGRSPVGGLPVGEGPTGTGRVPPLDAARHAVRSGLLVGLLFNPTGCLAASGRFSRIPDMLIAGIR